MNLPKIPKQFQNKRFLSIGFLSSLVLLCLISYGYYDNQRMVSTLSVEKKTLSTNLSSASAELAIVSEELTKLKNEDQKVRNDKLSEEINNIQRTYKKAVTTYERLLELKDLTKNTDKQDKAFAEILTLLSQKDYKTSDTNLVALTSQIQAEKDKIVSTFTIPQNVAVNNSAPGSGFQRQQVQTSIGNYLVDIVAADLGSTRVIVDTASDSDCRDNCPVLSLGDYVSRSGAFAGINGSYFCPASYPSCAGKTNSYDTLLMNKNKKYFNSDNNVYSTVPAVIFIGSSMRYVGQSLEWGRDTGVDGVIANQPLLLSGGNITFGGSGDPKQGSKGSRSFVGNKGSIVYIGVVHNATVAEVAHVLKALGLEGALNLDSGGSTALWSSGYKVGPGRNIPNAILFVRK